MTRGQIQLQIRYLLKALLEAADYAQGLRNQQTFEKLSEISRAIDALAKEVYHGGIKA